MNTPRIYRSAAGRQAILSAYDALLDRWPVPCERLTLPTALGNTFAIACGERDAPTLILLHGSSSNSAMWIGDVIDYARFFRVVAVDIPGEPGKSEPVRPSLKSDAYAQWISEVLDALRAPAVSLLGISLGGWLALKFAVVCPERVTRLVLLCPGGVASGNASFLIKAILLSPLGDWGRHRLVRIVYGDTPLPQEAIQYSRLIAGQFFPRMENPPLFTDEELSRLRMRVMLVAGAKDALMRSQQTADRLARLLPRLQATILPEAGHVLVGLSKPVLAFLIAPDGS